MPRVERDAYRLAEEHQLGTVGPDDACRVEPRRTLALLGQLGEDPAALFAHRCVDLAQRHPLGRADRQPLGADDEADAATARALEQKGNAPAFEHELAGRTRMP